jgi:hypothetical protein
VFLATLSESGNVGAACLKAGISRVTAYKHRAKDASFASLWESACEDAADTMEQEAFRRAVKGTRKPVYQGGMKVGEVTEYSDTLLIFLLKANRPAKFRDNYDGANVAAGNATTNELRSIREQGEPKT